MFHHRLGRIARELGDLQQAKREFEQALRLDPTQVEARLSLVSLAAEEGDVEAARSHFEGARRQPYVRRAVLHTVEATVRLAEGNFEAARHAVTRALSEERELPSLNLAARIELEAIAAGEAQCSDVSDTVRRAAEEIRLMGEPGDADRILERLAAVCG